MKNRPMIAACTLLLAIALQGCAGILPDSDITVTRYESGERWLNAGFYIIEHPFTDDGTARAHARAGQLCGDHQKTSVQSERACSLTQCTTTYVCMKPENAKTIGR